MCAYSYACCSWQNYVGTHFGIYTTGNGLPLTKDQKAVRRIFSVRRFELIRSFTMTLSSTSHICKLKNSEGLRSKWFPWRNVALVLPLSRRHTPQLVCSAYSEQRFIPGQKLVKPMLSRKAVTIEFHEKQLQLNFMMSSYNY